MSETFKSKLGTTRAGERTRIWIEGSRLSSHGFKVGTRFQRSWTPDHPGLVLTVCTEKQFNELARADRGTVSGKEDKPIIDVTGVKVSETFSGSHVSVTFAPRTIIIRNA